MLGDMIEYGEAVHDNHDHFVIDPQSGSRMRIKQEITLTNCAFGEQQFSHKQEIVIDSSRPSTSTLKHEDSCRSSYVKVKQESSKLNDLKKSLELNTAVALLVSENIQRIRIAYEKNLEKQTVLQKVLDADKKAKWNDKPPSLIRAISVFAAPYFRDVKRMMPPLNADTKIKRQCQDVNAYLRPPRPWTKDENKKLLDGVTGFALMSALKPHKIKRDYLKNKLKDQNLLEFEIEVLEKQIAATEKKIKCVSKKSLVELLKEVEGKIDWLNISAVNMEGEKTPDECENMWNNFLNFSINKDSFTFEEDERLKNLVEDNNERDWDTIAESLQTNRSAIQCFERYQTRLSTNLRKRFWTQEEDENLIKLVKKYRYGKIIAWNKISLLMEGRTRQQIINRYERSITQVYNRGPWTPEEDGMLIACYHKFGCRWAKMKNYFPKRSACALRERYVNSLDPSIKMGSWSLDEDKRLISLIRKYGYGKWSKICKHIPGRTDNMCLVRAGRILEYSVKYHSDKGSGEYDPGINDPELFAKILKPLAPTKELYIRNMKLKSCREDAMQTLLTAVRKVVPEFQVEEKNDSINFSWLSCELLQRISTELYKNLENGLKDKEPYVSHAKYLTKPLLIRKRLFEDSSEDDFDSLSPEKKLPSSERLWLDSFLSTVFQMTSKFIPPTSRKGGLDYNSREVAEISLYKAYLYKQFHCIADRDEDDDIENVIFSGIDFSETLQTVVSYFIQPPIYEGQFIVLSPNMTTLGGLEMVEITENRLQSMSKYVSHSKNYMDYICERRKSCPKCLQCLYREKQITSPSVSIEEVTSNMKKDHFFMDDIMEKAINVESGMLKMSPETCSCAHLGESRKSVQLLRQRFIALFLWPALFAATDLNKEQENILCKQDPHSEGNKNYYYRMNAGSPKKLPGKRYKRPLKIKKQKMTLKLKKQKMTLKLQNQKRKEKNVELSVNVSLDEPKPSTSRNTDSGNIQLNDTAKEKKIQKRKRQKKEREYPEVLRRSKRLCVQNRHSFSYPEHSHKRASSTHVSEETFGANPAVPSISSKENLLTTANPAVPSISSKENLMTTANPAVPSISSENLMTTTNPAVPSISSEENLMTTTNPTVLNDVLEECLIANPIVLSDA